MADNVKIDLSVVVPVYNSEETLKPLLSKKHAPIMLGRLKWFLLMIIRKIKAGKYSDN